LKGWLLDTNVIAEARGAKADKNVVRWLTAQPEETLYLSIITIAEYEKGIHHLPVGDPRRELFRGSLRMLEEHFAGRILSISDTVVRRWGVISGQTKLASGHSPTVIDTMLAVTAIEHELYLVTRNVRDVSLSGAAIFNPWTDSAAKFPVSRR
jgi:predicted nucleic acid-binding protein